MSISLINMKKLIPIVVIICILMLWIPTTLSLEGQPIPQNILIDKFYLSEGESHRIGEYDSYIRLDEIKTYSSDNMQLKYTFTSSNELVVKSLGAGEYIGYLRSRESPDRIGGFQIDVDQLNSTVAHFIITKDFMLINKEQCNNGIFEASDFVNSNCINCPDLRGDCSSDYSNVNYPLKIKELMVKEVISDETNIYAKTDTTYIKVKNEGDSIVNLKDTGLGLFSAFFWNEFNYNGKVFDKTGFAPGEEYSFSYEYSKMFSFLPYDCGKEAPVGLAYLPSLYVYGAYGGEVFAFNKILVECVFAYTAPASKPAPSSKPESTPERNGTFVFSTNEKLSSETDKLYVESKGTKEKIQVKILPADVLKSVTEGNAQTVEKMELKEENDKLSYFVKGTKQSRFLGVVPTSLNIELNVNAQSGNIETVKKPWWDFLTW